MSLILGACFLHIYLCTSSHALPVQGSVNVPDVRQHNTSFAAASTGYVVLLQLHMAPEVVILHVACGICRPLTRKAMALSEQQAVKQGSASAEMPRSSGAAQASLRPAAAQAVSEEPDQSHTHNGQPAEADVPIMDSLEHEIERLQRLEQRSAQLQTSQSGVPLLFSCHVLCSAGYYHHLPACTTRHASACNCGLQASHKSWLVLVSHSPHSADRGKQQQGFLQAS